MLNNHIIVGYGKWAKKIISFLIKYKIVKKIVIISSKKKFIFYPTYKNLNNAEFKNVIVDCQTAHICSPNNTHLKYFNFFSKLNKNFIIEKSIVNSSKEFVKLKLNYKNKYLVNYIDLFNYEISKIINLLNKYKNEKTIIKIIYSNHLQKNEKKKKLFNDWLDHPLALILFINKKYLNFKIRKYFSHLGKNGKYNETLEVEYNFKKMQIIFVITNILKKKRVIEVQTLNKKFNFNLNKNTHFKKSSFYRLYKNFKNIDNSIFKFDLSFHQKILDEKEKILNAIN